MERDMKNAMRKKQIIEAGKKLFSQDGYYDTHLESILKEAKIGKGTFYMHFKTKEELIVTILDEFLSAWEADLVKIREEVPEDLKQFYKTVLKRTFEYFQQDLAISNILLRIGPGTNDILESFVERFEKQVVRLIVNYLNQGIEMGLFRKDLDVDLIANILAGGHMRVFFYYFILKKGSRAKRNLNTLGENIFEMVISGLME
jgi:AcrR family transcriptional regulator